MQVYPNLQWLHDYLHAATFYSDPLRLIGYTLLVWLGRLTDLCSGAITALLGINVMNIGPVKALAEAISPVGWSILTVALTASGILMMFYSGKNKELLHNLFLAVVLIVAVPFMFSELNALKDAGVSDMTAMLTDNTSMGQQIIRSAVVDVSNSTSGLQTLPSGVNPYYLNINARLPRTAPWLYAVDSVSGNDNTGYTMTGHELSSGVFGLGKEELYTYGFDGLDGFLFPFLTLLITFATLAFSGFKVARILYDIAYHQLIAIPVFASDVNNGHRSKKFIQSLFSCFLILILVLLNLKLFLVVSSWLSLNVSNVVARILFLAGCAWGTIDGPDIVVHLLGMDAGVRNATNMLLGLNSVASLAGGVIGGGISAAGNLYSGARKAVGGISAIPRLAGSFREGMGAAAGVAGATAAAGIKGFAAKASPNSGGRSTSAGPSSGPAGGTSTDAGAPAVSDSPAQGGSDVEGSAAGGSSGGGYSNYAEFDQELNRRAQGVGNFAAGQTRMANRAARLGYFRGRAENGISQAPLKDPLSRAHEATHGRAAASAASVALMAPVAPVAPTAPSTGRSSAVPPSEPQTPPSTLPTASSAITEPIPEPEMPMTAPEPPEAPVEPQSSAPVNYTPHEPKAYDGPERSSNRDIYRREWENNARESQILNNTPQEPLWPGAHHGGDR